jgi:hypothetical protein
MDFGNIANTAQDLVKNAQGMMNNIDPNMLNQAEKLTGMDLNQDGSTGGAIAQTQAVIDDSTPVANSTSDEAVTAEESLAVETNDEVVE